MGTHPAARLHDRILCEVLRLQLETVALATPLCSLSTISRVASGKQSNTCTEQQSVTLSVTNCSYTHDADLDHGMSVGPWPPRAGQEGPDSWYRSKSRARQVPTTVTLLGAWKRRTPSVLSRFSIVQWIFSEPWRYLCPDTRVNFWT
jgi:hypothetical protein